MSGFLAIALADAVVIAATLVGICSSAGTCSIHLAEAATELVPGRVIEAGAGDASDG